MLFERCGFVAMQPHLVFVKNAGDSSTFTALRIAKECRLASLNGAIAKRYDLDEQSLKYYHLSESEAKSVAGDVCPVVYMVQDRRASSAAKLTASMYLLVAGDCTGM